MPSFRATHRVSQARPTAKRQSKKRVRNSAVIFDDRQRVVRDNIRHRIDVRKDRSKRRRKDCDAPVSILLAEEALS